ncbi:13115_t:CDS:2, partial [Gigaspora rosea]
MPPTKQKNKKNESKPSNNEELFPFNNQHIINDYEITNLKDQLEFIKAKNERLRQSQQSKSFNNIHVSKKSTYTNSSLVNTDKLTNTIYSDSTDSNDYNEQLPLPKERKSYKKQYKKIIDSSDFDSNKRYEKSVTIPSDSYDSESDLHDEQLPLPKKRKSYKKKLNMKRLLTPVTLKALKLVIQVIAIDNLQKNENIKENIRMFLLRVILKKLSSEKTPIAKPPNLKWYKLSEILSIEDKFMHRTG